MTQGSQNRQQTALIKFRVSPVLKTTLQQLAASRNITISALMRLIASEYMDHKRTE